MLDNFACFLSSADFLQNQLFRKIPSMSNSLDPDQVRYNLGPDLCPNCLYRLSENDLSRQTYTEQTLLKYRAYRGLFRSYSDFQSQSQIK